MLKPNNLPKRGLFAKEISREKLLGLLRGREKRFAKAVDEVLKHHGGKG